MQYKDLLNDLTEANANAGKKWDTATVRAKLINLSNDSRKAIVQLEEERDAANIELEFWKSAANKLLEQIKL